jgi:hypothetical protein
MLKNGSRASALLLCLLISCASCEQKPGRPAAELCTYQTEAQKWECEDSFNHVREVRPEELAATTWAAYGRLETYIDAKELRVRDLERDLAQCQAVAK